MLTQQDPYSYNELTLGEHFLACERHNPMEIKNSTFDEAFA